MINWQANVLPKQFNHRLNRFKKPINPPLILTCGFIVLIALGTSLLLLPIASVQSLSFMQAFFTASSAVTVTGLVVVDTGTVLTTFGQSVVMVLIQIGGIGFMTLAVISFLTIGKNLGLKQRLLASQAFDTSDLNGVIHIAKCVVLYSLIIEAIAFLLLFINWTDKYSVTEAAYQSLFYTISAFNNAGFALNSDSLMAYKGDAATNFIISGLFIIGGIGFTVLIDIYQQRRWSKLSTNTRLVLIATAIINSCAFLLIFLFEYSNPATLASLTFDEQILAAWFQAVTPRTAGFNTLTISELTADSTLLMLLLMIIGGGSVSTASGIKIGTFIILLLAMYSYLRQKPQVTVFNRQLSDKLVIKALSVLVLYLFTAFLSIMVISKIEQASLLDITFETISALSTVGLSRDFTSSLSTPSQLVIILLMLIGRVGPLTFAYCFTKPKLQHLKFAKTTVQIG
ncbi:TrkH family potassium uptake protein [Pseudoalteromonas sp. Angola-30]|uniref:TrkH family potassium uptake protein n=1 Tax=Pseudoalteromonas sp. Angola-30 TaxID=3025341 RepID=UPI0023584404|nr:TrkH family potassium uptake protein [Pseudoalteromonas sp. Angola-30]MDC9526801.1 TrkH family potassium uptake protein [Pseudoalteromonas sp. Angola-30]